MCIHSLLPVHVAVPLFSELLALADAKPFTVTGSHSSFLTVGTSSLGSAAFLPLQL